MRTIAIEEHFLSTGFKAVLHAGQSNSPTPTMLSRIQEKLSDLGDARLRDMDANGINLQVISHTAMGVLSVPQEQEIELVREANNQLAAAIATHPERFAGFATLPMSSPAAAADELARALRLPGFKAAMINGTTQGRFLDNPHFLPILEQATALQVPIYIHPGEPPTVVRDAYYGGFDPAVSFSLATAGWGWHSEVGIHALRLILAGVFDRFPDLQIIIGHMGEMLPFMLDRISNTLAPLVKNLKRPLPEYFLNNFTITTSGFFSDPPLLLALQTVGADRIIFSVDYPYSGNEQGRAFLDHAAISPADKEKISHLNAERVLKLG
ncbi:amidohydrolase family protein [Dictyobacter aurantiacus]|uniref:Amidohydrolase n=1 Tax=Dictyobacter aurantiacus TaxID=1936993 RepID=A0A401ZPP6_9CHLR|nr:amidohydrolase family protein [Dictyobacter aurantiacus]GCE08849.1 amidohydrolase [Dictyobacter aurantiacus]